MTPIDFFLQVSEPVGFFFFLLPFCSVIYPINIVHKKLGVSIWFAFLPYFSAVIYPLNIIHTKLGVSIFLFSGGFSSRRVSNMYLRERFNFKLLSAPARYYSLR